MVQSKPVYVVMPGLLLLSLWLGWRLWPVWQKNMSHLQMLGQFMQGEPVASVASEDTLTGFQARLLAQSDPTRTETWLTSGPGDASQPLTNLMLCEWYWQQGDFERAVAACRQSPSAATYWIELGIDAENANDWTASEAYYAMATELEANSGEAWYRLGRLQLRSQRYEEAIFALTQATALEWPSSYIALGQAYHENRQWAEAEAVLLAGTAVEPNRTAFLYLALGAEAQQKWLVADGWYQRMLDLSLEDGRAWQNRGRVAIQLSQYEQAVTYFRRAIELEPESAGLWLELANAAAFANNIPTATQAYQQTLAMDGSRPQVWHQAAEFYFQQGLTDLARQAFQQLLALQPDNQQAQTRLAELNQEP